MTQAKELYDFLLQAELQTYYTSFKNDLHVTSVAQLKYVEDEDLQEMGMTKPEMRRLKKFFKKECPQSTFGKLRRRILTSKESCAHQPGSPPVPQRSPLPAHKSPGKHIISEDSLTLLKTLGAGEFGAVQQGVWATDDGDRVQVAVKCLNPDKVQSCTADFLKEATIMHSLDHEHIVRLYGVVLSNKSLMLVTELAPLRSLLECLKEPALRATFTVTQLCDFACQIADGMTYLESKRFIHRDLAARNILVYAKDTVKITDFGLSRALGVGKDYYQTNFNINLKLPIAWCSPESINFLKFTSASDVWAYGATLWELFSYGFQPWAGCTGQQILDAIDSPSCQRLERPDCCPRAHYEVMLKCWEHDPETRPKFSELLLTLKQMKPEQVQALHDGPNPDSIAMDTLPFRANDIISVLDKKPEKAPCVTLWKGVLDSGKCGYFDPSLTAPYIEIKTSPHRHKPSISRKESARKSARSSKKLNASMISRPQCDLRHTGHIGYDGAVFGDVSFIGNNYDKLPVKVGTPTRKMQGPELGSVGSLTDDGSPHNMSQSQLSLSSEVTAISSGSQEDTLTDVSSMLSTDIESIPKSRSEEKVLENYGLKDDFLDVDFGESFSDFKLPDLGTTLDLGPSFMDEVMKALSETRTVTAKVDDTSKLLDDKSPLIEKNLPFAHGQTSFDNVAMTTECDLKELVDNDVESDHTVNGGSGCGSLSSFVSQEMAMDRGGESCPKPEEERKKKNKLKLFIPSWECSHGTTEGMKPLSASEEKKLDAAIELANEFAQLRSAEPRVPEAGDSEASGSESPHRLHFSLRRSKSPKPEKKTYTEEIASLSTNLNEDLTPEAQEAYNILVVKGSTKEKKPTARDRRVRRSLEHQAQPDTTERLGVRNSRNVNQNLRSPQGIPARAPVLPGCVDATDGGAHEAGEPDTNPLRRLRESSSFLSKPRLRSSSGGGVTDGQEELTNGWGGVGGGARKNEHIHRPNLNPNLPFFDKLKEQELEYVDDEPNGAVVSGVHNGYDDDGNGEKRGGVESLDSQQVKAACVNVNVACSSSACPLSVNQPSVVSTNMLPLPPRVAARPISLNQKPRERKYPLDLTSYKHPLNHKPQFIEHSNELSNQVDNQLAGELSSQQCTAGKTESNPRREPEGDCLNNMHESDDCVFTESGIAPSMGLPDHATKPALAKKSYCVSPDFSPSLQATSQLSISVKSVKVSASELGFQDIADQFWSEKVNFDEMAPEAEMEEKDSEITSPFSVSSPIPGRYKTSDTVSYEDLMEFALDGHSPRGSDECVMCDEVRLMSRVLQNQVTTEDCMYALEETRWDVHSAIKLIKLKQLLSTNLADQDYSKVALMCCHWSVEDAVSYIHTHPPGLESPDLVHV